MSTPPRTTASSRIRRLADRFERIASWGAEMGFSRAAIELQIREEQKALSPADQLAVALELGRRHGRSFTDSAGPWIRRFASAADPSSN